MPLLIPRTPFGSKMEMELKTRTDTEKVKFWSKVGDRVGVIRNKLPTGEWMANEVILSLPAPGAAAAQKDGTAASITAHVLALWRRSGYHDLSTDQFFPDK